MKQKILEFIESTPNGRVSFNQLCKHFDIPNKERSRLNQVLNQMEKEGLILRPNDDKVALPDDDVYLEGFLQGNERGFAFFLREEGEDIFIAHEDLNGAFDKDRVIVIEDKDSDEDRPSGKVVKILERGHNDIIGTYYAEGDFGFVVPDSQRFHEDIYIGKGKHKGAEHGQKVKVAITQWHKGDKSPEGKIVAILGYPGVNETDMQSIILNYELRQEFPEKVLKEAKKLPDEIHGVEGREDLTGLKTFTIDGIDAKDLDDAISIEKIDKKKYRLWVHIADVSYYVKPGSALDKEAYLRGNSVYLMDRVLPMLPPELSNGICSLNPHVKRYTMTVRMDIDHMGTVVDHKVMESVIESDARLNYTEVSDFLESDGKVVSENLADYTDEMVIAKELMEILYEKRIRRGAMDFNFPETKIILDEEAFPVEIKKDERRVGNRLIEEFMIVSNETVAEPYQWNQLPFIFRIHEKADDQKLMELNKQIQHFGYFIKGKEVHPKDLQQIISEVEGKPEELLINTLILRFLTKAEYSPYHNIHFGLASEAYTHFTAPIRRYPDLIVHRILKKVNRGNISEKWQHKMEDELPEIAKHVSETERTAEDAERDVVKFKMAQYMEKRIGNVYDGIISSLTNFGIFVQLPNTVEGLIHFGNMDDDRYVFDEERYQVVGENTNRTFKLGEPVTIEVEHVDMSRYTIDFKLIEDEEDDE